MSEGMVEGGGDYLMWELARTALKKLIVQVLGNRWCSVYVGLVSVCLAPWGVSHSSFLFLFSRRRVFMRVLL